MTAGNKEESTPERKPDVHPCSTPIGSSGVSLFERHWDEFVIKLGTDGKFRNFLQCCDYLTPV